MQDLLYYCVALLCCLVKKRNINKHLNTFSSLSGEATLKKFNTNCFVSQIYFVASELRPTVVFKFMLNGHGVIIVVCSPGYRSSSIVVFNFVSVVICILKISFINIKKRGKKLPLWYLGIP